MFKRAIFFIVGIFLFSVSLAQAQNGTKIFSGNIGENRFQMTLKREGDKLTGTYFYTKNGGQLNLAGKIDAEGKFVLTESDAKGTKTGEFSGTLGKAENENGFSLTGTWKNPRASKSFDFYAKEQMIFFSGAAKILPKNITESNKPKMFEITADYPELANAPNAAKFNQIVKSIIDGQVGEFRTSMLAQTAEDLKYFKQLGAGNYLQIGYNVEHADENIVSIGFFASTFTGGAHPNYYSFAVNFDAANGRELKLGDLFKPNSGYLQKISAYSIKKLRERLSDGSDDEWISSGAEAKEENYKSWNVTRHGILINFDPYQVASYAAGPQEVLIPFEELKEIIRIDGALKDFAK